MHTSGQESAKLSIVTVLLSSSVVIGIITGALYLVGGAIFEGFSHTLGLTYLAGWQPSEYVFAGAEFLLFPSYSLAVIVLVVAGLASTVRLTSKRIPRQWEPLLAFLTAVASLFLLIYAGSKADAARDLIRSSTCPIIGKNPQTSVSWIFITVVAIAGSGFFFFQPKLLRLSFVAWGVMVAVVGLYFSGWAYGQALLFQPFQIVEVEKMSAQFKCSSRLLVLRADDKDMVVLHPGTGRAEPMYVSRSDVGSFRLVGLASINEFVCNDRLHPAPQSEK